MALTRQVFVLLVYGTSGVLFHMHQLLKFWGTGQQFVDVLGVGCQLAGR